MPVHFIAGSAYDLREQLSRDMRAVLCSEDGENIVLVVPNQLTLEAERLALAAAGRIGSFRLHVLSPSRLCEKILSQAGGGGARIDENGRAMLMRRAIDSLEEPLRVFERSKKSAGFASLAAQAVSQWKDAGMDSTEIERIASAVPNAALADKLYDLAALSREWHACAQGLGMDDEDSRRIAMSRIADAPFFHGASVWFYGFDLLTLPISQSIIALSAVCRQLRVLVPLADTPRDERLYSPIRRTYERIVQMLRAAAVPFTYERCAPSTRPENAVRTLERELFCYPLVQCEAPAADVRLYAARNPRDEAEHIAACIRFLVIRRGYRYSDIALAFQDPSGMYPALRRAFALYDIPVFFPENRPASSHPLCASLLAAVRIAAGPVRESDVQTLLSLGYSPVSDDEADRMRNFAFSHGVTGRKWLRAYLPGIDPEGENAAFEEMRSRAFDPIDRLSRGMRSGSLQQRLEAVYRYLQETNAYARMLSQAEEMAAAGELVRAAEGGQVWTQITACLDQIATLYSGAAQPPSAQIIAELIEQSLNVAELKPLPQSADAVTAGSLEHMKVCPVRLLIIAGATDGEESSPGGILSDAERESLEKEVWLGPNRAERARMRMLAAKSAISFAQEGIWISWHVSGSDGAARRPGSLVRSVRAIFPHNPVNGNLNENSREQSVRLLHPDAALARAGEALRRDEGPCAPERAALLAVSHIPEKRARLEAMRGALLGDPLSESIPPETAQQLYDGPRTLSVTRLERFARCPFSHFLYYGAKPEEIREYGVTPRDSGDFCHEAISRFTSLYPQESDIKTAVRRMDSITADLVQESLQDIVQDGAVYQREAEQLRATARRAALTNLRHMGASRFSPVAAETAFAGKSAISLGDARLEGRIDRVDLWKNDAETWLRVVDYKRNGKELRLSQVYYGLQLQLLVYLIAAGAIYDAQYAAALYFNVSDPLVRTDSTDPDLIEESRSRELRLDGMILDDPQIVQAMSAPPEMALPIRVKKDGTLQKSDKLVSREDFALLARHALACAQRDLDEIRAGDIGAHPVSLDGATPCAYCDYAAVCRQDSYSATLRERRLPPLSAAEAMEAVRAQNSEQSAEEA